MRDKDPARVSEFVDFVLLRDSVKELLTARMDAALKTRGVPDDTTFASLAQISVKGIHNHAADAIVSPSCVVRLLQGHAVTASTPSPGPPRFHT